MFKSIIQQFYNSIILFALLFSNAALSINQAKVDSLQTLLSKQADDSNKVNLYFELGRQYEYFKSKERIEYFITALKLAKRISYSEGIKKVSFNLTINLLHRNMYDISMGYCLEYMDFLEKHNLTDDLYKAYGTYGVLLSKQGKFPEALKYYNLAKDFHLKNNNTKDYPNVLNNISILYVETNQPDSALKYSLEAIEYYKRDKSYSALANSVLGIAEIELKQGKITEAKEKATESLQTYASINQKHGMANALLILGQIHLQKNEIDSALDKFNSSLLYANESNQLFLKKDCYENISKAYSLSKKYKEAYDSYVIYKQYSDSISLENLQGRMLEMEVKYDISKKEGQLNAAEYELKSKNLQRNILFIGIIGVLLLLIISVRAYGQKKKANQLISEQKHLVEEKNKDITDSINYAKRIQEAILPSKELKYKLFPEAFVLFQPRDIVSGDFYWFTEKNGMKIIAAADCTGHGVPGAFMSMIGNAFLNEIVNEKGITQPSEILNKLAQQVVSSLKQNDGENKDGMDISLISMKTNAGNQEKIIVEFAGANNPMWIIRSGEVIEIKADKQPIGFYKEEPKPFTNHILEVQKCDSIYIFTDGFADQFGGDKGKKFKYKQLQELLISLQSKPMQEQEKVLLDTFKHWKAALDQVDDVLVIGIRI